MIVIVVREYNVENNEQMPQSLQQHLYVVNMYDVWKMLLQVQLVIKLQVTRCATLLTSNTNDIFGDILESYKMNSTYGSKYNSIKNIMKDRANKNKI